MTAAPCTPLPRALLCCALLACLPALCEGAAPPAARKPYPWLRDAWRSNLQPNDIRRLARDKVLLGTTSFNQPFTAYINQKTPVFITSDSLLAGYHVLFEESLLRLEKTNARKLPALLRQLRDNLAATEAGLKGDPGLLAGARLRAQVTLGTALRLLGERPAKVPAKVARLIEDEARRVSAAKGRSKPRWLGRHEADFVALDSTRYKPRGFYTRSEDLQRYFRAVSWLQSIPFRVERDEEFLALLLGHAASPARIKERARREQLAAFFRGFRSFVGVPDNRDLGCAAQAVPADLGGTWDRKRLARERLAFRKKVPALKAEINDLIRFPGNDDLSFRVLPAFRTPDAVLFGRSTDPRKFKRPFPSGLEVAAALGSSFARSRLTSEKEGKQVLAVVEGSRKLFAVPSLYAEELRCLAPLLGKPPAGAPAFMSREPWRIKSCQTVLASWAQLRHTWALHAKSNIKYMSKSPEVELIGFVEPIPEFYARLGRLSEKMHKRLKASGAFADLWQELQADLRGAADQLEKKAARRGGPDDLCRELIAEMRKQANAMPRAKMSRTELEEILKLVGVAIPNLDSLWKDLSQKCRDLERMSRKQLRGLPFNDKENQWLKDYGKALARLMLHDGDTHINPRDTMPRIADIFSNPTRRRGHLLVGVGRPRILYVLYPYKGKEILCRGAVLPYYEFRHPGRLTDARWKSLLDSKKPPELPAWVRPIVANNK
jgi:hypothetical protein